MTNPFPTPAELEHEQQVARAHLGRFRLLAACVMAVCIVSGVLYYRYEQRRVTENVLRELEANASLKAKQLADWRTERLSDASFLSRAPGVASDVRAYLANPSSAAAETSVRGWLDAIKGGPRYESMLLIDLEHSLRVAIPADSQPSGEHLRILSEQAWALRQPILSDVHRRSGGGRPHFDLVAPIFDSLQPVPGQLDERKPIAVIAARIDPRHFFFPLLQTWPNERRTGETLLVRREGDDVVYLNDLRFREDAALSLRRPQDLLFFHLDESITQGYHRTTDYRGKQVLFQVQMVPGTDWLIVSKMDIDEAFAELAHSGMIISLLVVVIMMAVFFGTAAATRSRENALLKRALDAEAQRSQMAERNRSLFENSFAAMLLINPNDGMLVDANPAASRFYGWPREEMRTKRVFELNPSPIPEVRKLMDDVRNSKRNHFTARHRRADGSLREVEVFASPIPVGESMLNFVIIHDITERKAMEAQLLQAQRMEALGTLAGGIAHDLNNILSPILLIQPLLHSRVTHPSDRDLLNMVATTARRGANIVQQLLAFSRGGAGERGPVQLRHLMNEVLSLVKETFPRDIEVRHEWSGDVWPVDGNGTQIHQILLNLCVNARDAMPRGGKLTLRGMNVTLTPESAELPADSEPGNFVLIEVSDTGTGIEPEILPRIFDPFFTTKPVGKGTGLGLSTVVGITRAHGGFVKVDSKLGHGSTFKVFLRANEDKEVAVPVMELNQENRGTPETTLLLVDDEPLVRDSARLLLEGWQYQVVCATDGADALTQFLRHRREINLVVTDLVMPNMDGYALVRALKAIDTSTLIIAITGYIEESQQTALLEMGVNRILTKPVEPRALLEAVRTVLDEKKEPAP
ncbi:MAG: response regulator [Opitutaceae bacterium]|nr:response regulator [Opitutaceae bacterium]